jgi:hypothetical protein
MRSMKQLISVTIAALLGSVSALPADDNVVIAQEGDKQLASFNIGASKCVLKDDQIRCAQLQPAAPSEQDARSDQPARTPTASRRVREQTPFNSDHGSTVTSPLYAEADASH